MDKYKIEDGEVLNIKTGKSIPPGEPFFVLRAKDRLMPRTLREYASYAKFAGCPPEFVAGVLKHAEEVFEWQVANPGLVKTPD